MDQSMEGILGGRDPVSPATCKIEPPQIGLCPAHPTVAPSDQDLGDSEARSTP